MNMALNPKPDIKEYFSQDILNKMPFFPSVFSRTRFLQIFWMLHVSPGRQSSQTRPTRGSKVRNVVKYIDIKCREHFKAGPKICVDESTVGYKGRISFKCYNPQKPTKWGLRVYILADCATGYVSAFEPYYGSTTTKPLPPGSAIHLPDCPTPPRESHARLWRKRLSHVHGPILHVAAARRGVSCPGCVADRDCHDEQEEHATTTRKK